MRTDLMHTIGIVGLDWRQQRSALLAELTIPRQARVGVLPSLCERAGVRELVYLATCGRVEVIFAMDEPESIAEARRRIFSALTGRGPLDDKAEQAIRMWQGDRAIEHLFTVASGLDSARIGESEVAGQLRNALADARAAGTSGPAIERAFNEAFRVARRIKPITEGRIGNVSLGDIAVRHAIERSHVTAGDVAVVGVSAMTERCVRALLADGATVMLVNRTLARAEELAAKVGGTAAVTARSLDDFRAYPGAICAMILATGACTPIFSVGDLERLSANAPWKLPPLLIDLGVPPNVDPHDAATAKTPRIGMEVISTEAAVDCARVLAEFADARTIIDDAVIDFRKKSAELLAAPAIIRLRESYRRTARERVERLIGKSLPNLDESDRETLRQWADTLALRLAHVPTVGLRELASTFGSGATDAFFGADDERLRRDFVERDPAVVVILQCPAQ
jgi:glutamyl-tRNA reductase